MAFGWLAEARVETGQELDAGRIKQMSCEFTCRH
jgi:hypothetical protein